MREDMRSNLRPLLPILTLAAALMAGCEDTEEPADDDDTTPEVEPGEVVLTATPSERVPTVLQVTLAVDDGEVTAGAVEFGLSGALDRAVEAGLDGDGVWSALVWGLPAGEEVQLLGRLTVDGEERESDVVTLTLGGAPTDLPSTELTVGDESTGPGGFLVTSFLSLPPVAVVLDDAGRPIWWYQPVCDECVITRAHLSQDRTQMLLLLTDTSAFQEVEFGDQWIWRVGIDGTLIEEIVVPGAQRDFLELDDGTLAVITMDVRSVEGQDVVGDRLVELAPDGSVRQVWSVWDHLEYDPTNGEDGFCHANAVDYDPVEDDYLLSCHRLDVIFRIDRATGDVVWALGGDTSDFLDSQGSIQILQAQHQFQLIDGGIIVFNNRTPYVGYSEVSEYVLDTDAFVAESIWTTIADPPLFCYVLGDVTRYDDGRTLITWSTAGQIDLLDADGDVDWQLQTGIGAAFGYTTFFPSLY